MSELSETVHCWHSAKSNANSDVKIYYMIDGEVKRVSDTSKSATEHNMWWDDVVYLGQGTHYHTEHVGSINSVILGLRELRKLRELKSRERNGNPQS